MNNKMWKFIWTIVIASFIFCVVENIIANQRSEAFSEGYNAGYESAASMLRKATRPESGTILSGYYYDESEITVTADSFEDYVVSLKNVYGDTYISFYVRAGETVSVGVPYEHLRVHFACGEEWYGYGKGLMFGPNTYYSKDDEILNFVDYAWEYTLHPVTDGNFSETPSSAEEFFQ